MSGIIECIPELHARGTGAHGHLSLQSASKYISAPVLSLDGPIKDNLRISNYYYNMRIFQDTVRDVRRFAAKSYTDENNRDIFYNNIPVLFIQDATEFLDIIQAVKPELHNEVPTGQSAHNSLW
jgi:catalase